MKTDLISREALKEYKFVGNKYVQIGGRTNGKTLENINNAYQKGWNDCIDAIIDNAPTVEPFEPDYVGAERLKARQRGYTEGYHYGMKIGKTLNPKMKQGKWIIGENNMDYPDGWATCSYCGYKMDVKRWEWLPAVRWYLKPNYCPECGAKMET